MCNACHAGRRGTTKHQMQASHGRMLNCKSRVGNRATVGWATCGSCKHWRGTMQWRVTSLVAKWHLGCLQIMQAVGTRVGGLQRDTRSRVASGAYNQCSLCIIHHHHYHHHHRWKYKRRVSRWRGRQLKGYICNWLTSALQCGEALLSYISFKQDFPFFNLIWPLSLSWVFEIQTNGYTEKLSYLFYLLSWTAVW